MGPLRWTEGGKRGSTIRKVKKRYSDRIIILTLSSQISQYLTRKLYLQFARGEFRIA